MLIYEEINKTNLQLAINIQKEIFPNENGSQDLIDSMNGIAPNYQFLQKYYKVF